MAENRTKYKYGQKDLDLEKYIVNLGHNVSRYVDSLNWNEGLRLEFMLAYNNYLTGLLDLLTNNTNRFSSDDFGNITDSTGLLGQDDGQNFYYNDKGEQITGEELLNLKKRKQKKYTDFSANTEVANYFKVIANNLSPVEKKKKDKFDIAKHGFIKSWSSINNPNNGKLDLTPYLNKDKFDKESGKRARTNRATYLAEQIANYLNNTNFDDYDFSGTVFKDANTYKSKLLGAVDRLNDGTWTDEDLIALNQAGIGGDFQIAFFSEEENPNLSESEKEELAVKAKKDAEEAEQKRRKEIHDIEFLKANQDIYNANRGIYHGDNPLYVSGRLKWFNNEGLFDRTAFARSLGKNYLVKNSEGEEVGDELKINALFNAYLKNPFANPNTDHAKMVEALIDYGYGKQITNPNLAGWYYLPSKGDKPLNRALIYNPETGQLKYTFIGDIPEAWLNMWRDFQIKQGWIDGNQGYAFMKEGGTFKYQMGGGFNIGRMIVEEQEQGVRDRAKLNGVDVDVQRNSERELFSDPSVANPNADFSHTDIVRAASLVGDITSMFAGLTGFAPVSVGAGLISTAANLYADIVEDGPLWSDAGNALMNAGMDLLGAIPVIGATSKTAKITKTVVKWAPRVLAFLGTMNGVANAPEIMKSFSKITKEGEENNLTVADWRNIVQGFNLVLSGAGAAGRAYRNRAVAKANKVKHKDSVAVAMKDSAGNKKTFIFEGDDAKQIRQAASNGDNEGIRSITNKKYEDLKDYDLDLDSTTTWHRPGRKVTNADGTTSRKWSPRETTEGLAKIFDLTEGHATSGAWDTVGSAYTKRKPGTSVFIDKDGKLYKPDLLVTDNMRTTNMETREAVDATFTNRADVQAAKKARARLDYDKNKLTDDLVGKFKTRSDKQQANLNTATLTRRQNLDVQRASTQNIKKLNADLSAMNDELNKMPKNKNGLVKRTKDAKALLQKISDTKAKINSETIALNNARAQNVNLRQSVIDARTASTRARERYDAIAERKRIANDANYKTPERLALELSLILPDGSVKITGLGANGNRERIFKDFNELLLKYDISLKQGGSLDLKKVRKANNGMKTNTVSTANWFDDMFLSPLMKSWLNSFDTNNFENFNALQKSWSDNKYATGYTPGAKSTIYNQRVWDRQKQWNQTGTNAAIEAAFGNGDVEGDYLDGYFGELEFLRHGGTKDSWAGKENQLKAFQAELANKGLQYTLDEKSGMYLMSRLPKEQMLDSNGTTVYVSGGNGTGNDSGNSKSSLNNYTDEILGDIKKSRLMELGRLYSKNRFNKELLKQSLTEKGFYQDPLEVHRSEYGDLRAKMEGQQTAGQLASMASRPLISDGNLLTATLFEAALRGLDYINAGNKADDEMYHKTSELAWQQEKENAQNRHLAAMQNRLSFVLLYNNRLNKILGMETQNENNNDVMRLSIIYDQKTKEAENKAKEEAFAKSDIQSAVAYNLKEYYPEMSLQEEAVWNKHLGGVLYSDMSTDELKLFLQILKKVDLIEQDQLRSYWGIGANRWTGLRNRLQQSSPNPFIYQEKPVESAKNGTKIQIAGIKAKTADAERFLKQIQKFIERNDKLLERLTKAMSSLPQIKIVK